MNFGVFLLKIFSSNVIKLLTSRFLEIKLNYRENLVIRLLCIEEI